MGTSVTLDIILSRKIKSQKSRASNYQIIRDAANRKKPIFQMAFFWIDLTKKAQVLCLRSNF